MTPELITMPSCTILAPARCGVYHDAARAPHQPPVRPRTAKLKGREPSGVGVRRDMREGLGVMSEKQISLK